MYYVYVLQSEKNGCYYVGSTGDLDDRLKRHNNGESKSTKPFAPYSLVYKEKFDSLPAARRREFEIKKKKSRRYIEELIDLV